MSPFFVRRTDSPPLPMPPGGSSLRLTFKGDKPKRKRKTQDGASRKRAAAVDDESDAEMYGGDEQAWVTPDVRDEVTGPCFVHQRREDGSAIVLSFNAPLSQVETSKVEVPSISIDGEGDGPTIAGVEVTPQTVHQVWVATSLPESDKWTMRSAQGTFLAADKYGDVTATNEARGPHAEWTLWRVDPVPCDDAYTIPGPRAGYAFQSKHGGWLATDDTSEQRKRLVRADATDVSGACVWDIRVQWRFRHACRKAKRGVSTSGSTSLVDEAQLARSRQGWTAGAAHHVPPASRRELLRAQREGRLAEAMLDRRSQLKSDKYTK